MRALSALRQRTLTAILGALRTLPHVLLVSALSLASSREANLNDPDRLVFDVHDSFANRQKER